MKLFVAGLATETNTFSPFPTGMRQYEQGGLYLNGVPEDDASLFAMPVAVWKRLAKANGWQVAEGLCAWAEPSGSTVRAVYEELRDGILSALRQALPVDAVLLSLHGAMIAEGYDDCEGDLLARVRALVGPGVPVGAELDPHTHLTPEMLQAATALICFKEFPHIDYVERAEELFALIARTAAGEVRPHMATWDCRMVTNYFTTLEPMKGYVARLRSLEGSDGVLSISFVHGFPSADVPELGAKLLVITDDRPAQGAALAKELGLAIVKLRGQTRPPILTLDAAFARLAETGSQPIVFADRSDNPGGGAPGDSTFLLRALLERGIAPATVACVYDPMAVQMALAAGEGATLNLRIGGKMGPDSGNPMDLRVTVQCIRRPLRQRFGATAWNDLGDAAAVSTAAPAGVATEKPGQGVTIVLVSHRSQTFGLEPLTEMGIDPASQRVIVVKSTNHFRTAYEPVAAEILYVATPGTLNPFYEQMPYTRVRRPIWPLDDYPWEDAGL